jgi:ABC-type transporter Mla subunit MlaD
VPSPVWISLILLLVAVTFAAFHLFRRARTLLRAAKSFGPALDESMREITRLQEELARNGEALDAGTQRLDASLARLRVSLARAAVLAAAVQEVRDSLDRVAWAYPRK